MVRTRGADSSVEIALSFLAAAHKDAFAQALGLKDWTDYIKECDDVPKNVAQRIADVARGEA